MEATQAKPAGSEEEKVMFCFFPLLASNFIILATEILQLLGTVF